MDSLEDEARGYCEDIRRVLPELTEAERVRIQALLADVESVIPRLGPATSHMILGEVSSIYEQVKTQLVQEKKPQLAQTMQRPKHRKMYSQKYRDRNDAIELRYEDDDELVCIITKGTPPSQVLSPEDIQKLQRGEPL